MTYNTFMGFYLSFVGIVLSTLSIGLNLYSAKSKLSRIVLFTGFSLGVLLIGGFVGMYFTLTFLK